MSKSRVDYRTENGRLRGKKAVRDKIEEGHEHPGNDLDSSLGSGETRPVHVE